MPSKSLALLWMSFLCGVSPIWAQYGNQKSHSLQGETIRVRRERNLDHWDSDTLAYYMDSYPGHDMAIMFYASWDSNSHTLAPYWDRIATILEAGTTRSNLVMALFDCELNAAHAELCKALSITHYPTLLFVGSGPYHDTDPISRAILGKDKAAGIMGATSVENTVKFQGNWQYTDSILDWVRTMRALSNWHIWSTQGFGRRLRNLFWPLSSNQDAQLPVGIPRGAQTPALTGTSGSQPGLQQELDSSKAVNDIYEKMVLRQTEFLNTVLTGDTNGEDMFAWLDSEKVWDNRESSTPEQEVIRNCVMELSLDYCQKVSTKVANDLVDELEASGKTVDDMLAMSDLEEQVLKRISKAEPYCGRLDACIASDFADKDCKPKKCPFQNSAACIYLTSCRNPELQKEHVEALGIPLESKGTGSSSKEQPATANGSDTPVSQKDKKGWGF